MQDKVYCYPDSNVLINKLNIRDDKELFEAEKALTFIRLQELQKVYTGWSTKAWRTVK